MFLFILALFLPCYSVCDEVCYQNVGCFSQDSPWTGILRPFPPPQSPEDIETHIYLYTRKSQERYNVTLGPPLSLKGSNFNPKRITVFMTHGLGSDGNVTWLNNLKNAYLKAVDSNVFIVDWGKGASVSNFLATASNTRVVGVQVARFLVELIKHHKLKRKRVHLIGHSLGAHIMGYVGKNVVDFTASENATEKQNNTLKVARITGLDPAQPGFEDQPPLVRLDKGDARFVDVVHSDAKPFIPLFGFGILAPIGHIDFYLNQGSFQPGCIDVPPIKNVTNILDLAKITVKAIVKGVSCSHGRSYEVYTSAISSNSTCNFLGKRIITNAVFLQTGLTPIKAKSNCGESDCVYLGLGDIYSKVNGAFQVMTSGKSPFCCKKHNATACTD